MRVPKQRRRRLAVPVVVVLVAGASGGLIAPILMRSASTSTTIPAVLASSPSSSPAQRGGPRPPTPGPTPIAPTVPCGVVMQRSVSPPVLRAGDVATVRVDVRWACDGRNLPPTDLMIAIEDSEALRGSQAWGLPQPLFSLKLAMPRLLDAADAVDARVGLLRYARSWRLDAEVAGGKAHRDAVRAAIGRLEEPMDGDPRQFTGLQAAVGNMPAAPRRIVLLVDAGQPFQNRGDENTGACFSATASLALAIVSLPAAERRYAGCATTGLFFESHSPAGADLAEIIDAIVDATLREQAPTSLRYEHPLDDDAWTLESSGVLPRAPDEASPHWIAWTESVRPAREGTLAYRYQLRAAADLTPGEHALAAAPGPGLISLFRADRVIDRFRAERVCIYREGRKDDDCGSFAANATATAAARSSGSSPTPAATETPNGAPPDATSTPTRTATPMRTSIPTRTLTPTRSPSSATPTDVRPTVPSLSAGYLLYLPRLIRTD